MAGTVHNARMKIGAIVPQGWVGEYDGWEPLDAWRRSTEVARQAERLGFESIWLFDHFHTVPRPTDEITFESFTSLAALAALTERVRLGHIVICTAFRNPALTAKMISTMDTISGGRMELGIGAGWKRDEWLAYGYGFPETKERLARLADDLGVITAMLEGDRHDTCDVRGPIRPRPRRDQRSEADPAAARPDHGRRQRTERDVATGRPPRGRAERRRDVAGRGRRGTPRHRGTVRGDRAGPGDAAGVGPHLERDDAPTRERLGSTCWPAYREAGVSRVMGLVRASATTDEALESLVEDARAAGVEFA